MDVERKTSVLSAVEGALWAASALGVTAVVTQVGGHVAPAHLEAVRMVVRLLLACFIGEQAIRLWLAEDRRRALAEQAFDILLILVFLPVTLLLGGPDKPRSWLIWGWLCGHLLHRAVILQRLAARMRFRPAHILVASFLIVIGIGFTLLYSPRATVSGEFPRVEDALFTATSAVCVTGLVVQDTGTYWSSFGQLVILVLIQIGGLGMMTFGAFFAIILTGGMRLREQVLIQDVLSYEAGGRMGWTVLLILLVTAAAETLGAALLFVSFGGAGPVGHRLYVSLFHAVSAFCNAGFSLFPNNLEGYVGNVPVNLTIMGLIVVGGLGFVVVANLLGLVPGWVRQRAERPTLLQAEEAVTPETAAPEEAPRPPTMLLQTKLVLLVTTALILSGFIAFLLLEWNHAYGTLPLPQRALAALFQSVTARTAGFDTVGQDRLTPASEFLSVILMFIGASPGGTGGGIKTTTFALLLLAVIAIVRNRTSVETFGRTIPGDIVNKAITVVFLAASLVAGATVAVLVLESNAKLLFLQVLFEVTSAFGTVGLSTGITSSLGPAAKVVLCLVMMVGRIGPLTLVLAISQQGPKPAYAYPRGTVMVG